MCFYLLSNLMSTYGFCHHYLADEKTEVERGNNVPKVSELLKGWQKRDSNAFLFYSKSQRMLP